MLDRLRRSASGVWRRVRSWLGQANHDVDWNDIMW